MKKMLLFFALLIGYKQVFAYDKLPRTIVTTDGEIDDVDTFIRMLLYSNEYKVEGLVYSSSMWHYKGDGKGTLFTSAMPMTKAMYGQRTDLRWAGVQWMQDLLAAYKKVYPNLLLNSKKYPTPAYLMSLVKVGNIDFEGEMDKITDGSEWIKSKLLDADPEPIYLQAWGGTNTIARALKSIEDEYSKKSDWKEIKEKISKKAIIYTVMDQDATYKNYIGIHWPKIVTYYNSTQFGAFAYPWKKMIPLSMQPYFEGPYMSSKIILSHGALLDMYYSYGDGKKQTGDPEHIHGDLNKIKNSQWGSFNQYDFTLRATGLVLGNSVYSESVFKCTPVTTTSMQQGFSPDNDWVTYFYDIETGTENKTLSVNKDFNNLTTNFLLDFPTNSATENGSVVINVANLKTNLTPTGGPAPVDNTYTKEVITTN